ncbi:MAG: cytochrome c oxidase subunit 4, partial [Planctomycetes bacterium]|nr:cytochrome c oxidase subunit 4 [Planctomycetota bacterium]
RRGKIAGNDPWDAQTLEWTISSPPPDDNFAKIPVVHSRRPFWDQKYLADTNQGGVHSELSQPFEVSISVADHFEGSFYPIIVGLGLTVAAYGLIYTFWLAGLGVAITLFGIFGWHHEHR